MLIRGPLTLAERQRRLSANVLSVQQTVKPSYSCPECRTLQYEEIVDLTRNFFVEKAVENFHNTGLSKADQKDENLCQLHKMPLILCKLSSMNIKLISIILFN